MTKFKKKFPYLLLLFSFCQINCSKSSHTQDDLPNSDQYITWDINGSKGSLTSPSDSIGSARYSSDTHIVGLSTSNQNGIYIIFNGNRSTGIYTAGYNDFYIDHKTYTAIPQTLHIIITKYGDVGDYIIGSYSGNFTDSTAISTFSIKGNFKLLTR